SDITITFEKNMPPTLATWFFLPERRECKLNTHTHTQLHTHTHTNYCTHTHKHTTFFQNCLGHFLPFLRPYTHTRTHTHTHTHTHYCTQQAQRRTALFFPP